MTFDHLVEQTSRAVHTMLSLYAASCGKRADGMWDELPEKQREEVRLGTQAALRGITVEECHGVWLAKKLEDGWSLGDELDEKKKKHPCLVPYQDLSTYDQYWRLLLIKIAREFSGAVAAADWSKKRKGKKR